MPTVNEVPRFRRILRKNQHLGYIWGLCLGGQIRNFEEPDEGTHFRHVISLIRRSALPLPEGGGRARQRSLCLEH
jgi:hypothetical protein